MSKEKSQSAIDAVYEILEKLEKLESQVKIIDTNIKLLNNKVSKMNKALDNNNTPRAVAPRVANLPSLPSAQPVSAVVEAKEVKNVKVFSRIKNKRKIPIKGIDIKIYSSSGEIVKARKTDDHGYWEARIPPGEYGIEYDPTSVNSNLKKFNFNVRIRDGVEELDLSDRR